MACWQAAAHLCSVLFLCSGLYSFSQKSENPSLLRSSEIRESPTVMGIKVFIGRLHPLMSMLSRIQCIDGQA